MPIHSIILYSYYYNNGVIELPPSLAGLVHPEDSPVRLLLGDNADSIEGQISWFFSRHYRKRLSRINGGEKLRDWFQMQYQIDNYIEINFISFEVIHFPENPIYIELHQKDVLGLIEMFLGYTLERDWLDDTTVTPMLRREIVRRGELAVDPLISLLVHPDWAVRDDAARMLGYLRDARAVDPLLIAMVKDKSRAVQESVIEALLRIGTPRALTLVKAHQNFLREKKENG